MHLKQAEAARGVTLIELMAVLVVIAILGLMAYPSYRDAVRKGKRAEGRAALQRLMQQEELYFSRRNTYIRFSRTSSDEDEKKFRWYSGNSPRTSAYEIKAEPCNNETIHNCVVLIASPGTAEVDSSYEDLACGELRLTSSGIKTANDPDCWK